MKISVTQQLKELDGTLMVTGRQICPTCGQVVGKSEPMTVRLAATRALTAQFRDEQDLTGEQKFPRFHLALKITDEDEPDLAAEDIATIKKLVGKMYGSLVMGRVWMIIDPPGTESPALPAKQAQAMADALALADTLDRLDK